MIDHDSVKKQYRDKLVERINHHLILNERELDDVDKQCVDDSIDQYFNLGFTLDDAYKAIKYSEHVNPNLDEKYACAVIGEIYRKYQK